MRNALSDNLTPALRTMIRTCGENPEVGALLITGAGEAFCAGGDVKGMGAHRDPKKLAMSFDEKVADLQERQRLLTGALVSVRKPTIAALPGPAAGAGLAIAMACDIRIAAESAFVSTGYLRVGLSGDYGIAWLLTRLVGTARARELMFTSEKVDAARCAAIGLVNRVVPDANLQDEAFALAKSMAEGPAIALRYMKDNLDEALLFDFATARDHEAERLIRTTMTSDHREAVQAFIEKRKAGGQGEKKKIEMHAGSAHAAALRRARCADRLRRLSERAQKGAAHAITIGGEAGLPAMMSIGCLVCSIINRAASTRRFSTALAGDWPVSEQEIRTAELARTEMRRLGESRQPNGGEARLPLAWASAILDAIRFERQFQQRGKLRMSAGTPVIDHQFPGDGAGDILP